ncbi:hypothetical protein EV421DRAFT_1833182 [Armillaria borealis]|uniref:Uncharacterized protein n=1 Tax=Armillaria borealis TaxID=47425 RepID=A0AA39MJH3_9AGAR|nr:hypothetical protein EV421DRAFT_1833182 [Armillaria borealis]
MTRSPRLNIPNQIAKNVLQESQLTITPQTIWLMNVFNAGSRVSFYDSTGRLVNGTVQFITRTSDGAQFVLIKRDNGGTVTLP